MMQESAEVILGHLVVIGISEEDVGPADLMTVFSRSIATVYSGEVELWKGLLLFFDDGCEFNPSKKRRHGTRFIEAQFGVPDRVTVTFPDGALLSRELTLDSQIIEVAEE